MVKHYDRALDVILDEENEEDYGDNESSNETESDEGGGGCSSAVAEAQTLYGLIHARYVVTNK